MNPVEFVEPLLTATTGSFAEAVVLAGVQMLRFKPTQDRV